MADFRGEALDAGGDHAECGEIHGVPVARDDLRGDRFGFQAQRLGDMLLDARVDIGECADRP